MPLLERIKSKCIENNTNFKQLEEELGFGNGTIRKWETQKPSYDKVVAVANKLNISLDWLILGKECSDISCAEQKLISLYRQADERGKRNIMRQAEAEISELPSANNQTSLDSKTG